MFDRMGSVTADDVMQVARVLRALPKAMRGPRLLRLLAMARAAEMHVRLTGRGHPLWGRGPLADTVAGLPKAEIGAGDDPEWCDCTVSVWDALLSR